MRVRAAGCLARGRCWRLPSPWRPTGSGAISRTRDDTDPGQDSTPELRADDLSRLLAHLGAGPAAVLGSSGGAVAVLALAQAHPEQVRTVIAHEPPLIDLLPDRAERHAGNEDVIARWFAGDQAGSWRAFVDNADTSYQNGHMLRPTTHWQPDLTVLRSAAARVVVGVGETSAGQLCDRTSRALATALGVQPTVFPGGHTGFAEDPEGFAARLRSVLGEN
jgi:pimeloyl-ACP methyl ester carboxylesterase